MFIPVGLFSFVIEKTFVLGVNSMSSYTDRDALLVTMGYRSYEAYLASELWRSIRDRAIKRDKHCVVCGGEIECVHHESYANDVLRGANIRPLKSLCHDCHKVVEFRSSGEKRSMEEANVILHRLITGEREMSHKTPSKPLPPIVVAIPAPQRKFGRNQCQQCGRTPKQGKKLCGPCLRVNEPKRKGKSRFNACAVCRSNPAKIGESICGRCRREKPLLIQTAVRK